MTNFEQFTSTPDRDGDSVTVTKVHPDHYTVRVQGTDGDFQTAFVSADEMMTLAHAVLAAHESACTCYRSDGVHYSSCPMWDEAMNG